MQHYLLRIRTCLLNSTLSTTSVQNTSAITEKNDHSTNMITSKRERLPRQPQLPSEVWIASQTCVNKNFTQRLSKQTAPTILTDKIPLNIRPKPDICKHDPCKNMAELKPIKKHLAHAALPAANPNVPFEFYAVHNL